MASRKEQKEQARADRLAKEEEAAARAGRTRRLQILGGVVVVAVAVIVVAIVVSSGGGSAPPVSHTQAKSNYASVKTLLNGIPESGTTLGNPQANVTMTYFGDLECPDCRDFTLTPGYLSQFISSEVRTGNVKITYRSFCTATCYKNPLSTFNEQQVAAYAAGQQHLFWQFAEMFYREQGSEDVPYVTATWLKDLAAQIPPLKISQWQTDLGDPSLLAQVNGDMTEATKLNLQGTPTLIMSGPKGHEQVTGPNDTIPDASQLEAAVQAVA